MKRKLLHDVVLVAAIGAALWVDTLLPHAEGVLKGDLFWWIRKIAEILS